MNLLLIPFCNSSFMKLFIYEITQNFLSKSYKTESNKEKVVQPFFTSPTVCVCVLCVSDFLSFLFLSGSKGANKLQASHLSSKRLLADSPEKRVLAINPFCNSPSIYLSIKSQVFFLVLIEAQNSNKKLSFICSEFLYS